MDGLVAPRPKLALPRRSLRSASDERLVAQIRRGDAAASRIAFEALYDRHHRGILAYCRHLLGSQEEAEDTVQHTFSAAYRALLRDDREISLRAWLYAIARNRCLSVLAARREQVDLDSVESVLPATIGLAVEVEQRADLRELLADLQRLPEEQRSALILSELEAHTHAEIAEILGVRPTKVKALVFQAREALMISRKARETDCVQVRQQLSVLRGSSLRRRELRRHVEGCEGCRAFEVEVRRQRAGMAVLLPVVPSLALKHSSLAAAFAAGGTGAASGTAAVGGGGALVAGGLVVGTKTIAAKALAAMAIVAGAGGGGYAAVNEITHDSRPAAPASDRAAPAASQTPARSSAPVAGTIPAVGIASGTANERAQERARLGSNKKTGARDAPRNGRDGRPTRGIGRPTAKAKAKAKTAVPRGPGAVTKKTKPPKTKVAPAPNTGGASGTAASGANGSGPVVEPRQRRPDDVGRPAVTDGG